MIKASELRMGNYVWNDIQNIPVKVDVSIIIQQDYYDRFGKDKSWQPITITEDILLKCGFVEIFGVRKEYKKIINKNKDILVINIVTDEVLICGDNDVITIKQNLNENNKEVFLHTLQNLYFALTGEELTIKL